MTFIILIVARQIWRAIFYKIMVFINLYIDFIWIACLLLSRDYSGNRSSENGNICELAL
jgi:hypothetical protein